MTKWTTADIPDQTGRTAVITGANTGLGYETAAALAAKGAHVVLAVRNLDKGKDAADRITKATPGASVAVQELDLTSLESVRAAADELRSGHDTIDLLINNAGVMFTPKSTTKDGFELQFGTNHLGHFAFTGLLLDRVLAGAGFARRDRQQRGPSLRPRGIHFDDLQWERSYSRVGAYGQAKLANLMFTYELQRRLAGHQHHRRRRTPRRVADRTDPQSAAAGWGRDAAGRNRSSRTPTWVRCRRCARPPIPACSAGSTSAPTDSASSGATRRSWRPAGRRTTSTRSAGCGRCPRSSPAVVYSRRLNVAGG